MRVFHRPLAHHVTALAATIAAAYASTRHASWSELGAELTELAADLTQHIEMEERVVFPWLRKRTASASSHQTIRALQLEHGDAILHLLAIDAHARRCHANDLADAHARVAITALHQFERWLCEHIHIESNTLFPNALQAELARR